MLITRQSTDSNPEAPLAVMFGDIVDKGKATDEATRSATASSVIAKIADGFGLRPRLEDLHVVTRRPEAPAAGDTAETKKLPVITGNVTARVYAAATTVALLIDIVGPAEWARDMLDCTGRRSAITQLGDPHLEDAERPIHKA